RDAGREVLPGGARGEYDRAVAACPRVLGHRAGESFRRVAAERGARRRDDLVGAVLGKLVGAAHGAGAEHEGLDLPAQPIGEPASTGHDFMGDLPQRPVALLEHGEDDRHRTFASSRSSRTSSGTASGPSPTILPSLRSAGGSSASTSIPPAARATGFVSSGFFLAAMMPLSAG